MPRAKYHTLTEQMFYVLLCLTEPCCGIYIMDRISAITAGRVEVGSGTLYNLLEQFSDSGMIRLFKEENRRKSYILTDKGRQMLVTEYQRLQSQMTDYQRILGKEQCDGG